VARIFCDEDDSSSPQHAVGDVAIDDFGETLFVVNAEGTFLKTYSIYDLRFNNNKTEGAKPLQ
jgi:hypothetical protein